MSESTTTGPGPTSPGAATEGATIRPFHVSVPEAELEDLRARIAATRWPEKETVEDAGARALLGVRVRLAQVRGETEGSAALHHRDRWAGHSLRSRPLEA